MYVCKAPLYLSSYSHSNTLCVRGFAKMILWEASKYPNLSRKEGFLEHINILDPHIQFTTAKPRCPFLDTIVMPHDVSLITTVYRKSTHTDLYIHWDSHHHLSAKFRLSTPSYTELRQSVPTTTF